MAIATGDLCPAGRQTLSGHEERLDRLERQADRTSDKLDAISKQMTTLIVAVATLALTLAANLAQRLIGS